VAAGNGSSWRDLSFASNARVHSVFSRTQASMQEFSKEFGGCKMFSSIDELLADSQVDIVYISSPNHLHYPQAKLALETGKPVLCEKPFTLNAGQLAELIDIAKSQKAFLMEAMWIRWLPIVVKLRQVLTDGVIGELHFWLVFVLGFPLPDGRIYNLAMGGGLTGAWHLPNFIRVDDFRAQPEEIASPSGQTGIDEHFGAIFIP
jgi:predicted dehydrogenase